MDRTNGTAQVCFEVSDLIPTDTMSANKKPIDMMPTAKNNNNYQRKA